jgi:F-type H+-transporting ATPase subunit gamma
MPTLKEIAARISAVNSIKETTEAMKMIAQARVAKAEVRLAFTRTFSKDIEASFSALADWAEPAADDTLQILAMGTDQGLCGSINSGMARAVKARTEALDESGTEYTLYPVGNRVVTNLTSKMPSKLTGALFGSQKFMTFRQCLATSERLLQLEPTKRQILYNEMINLAAFKVEEVNVPNRASLANAEEGPYEIEGVNEVLDDFYDYHFAVLMWRLHSEVETSELTSRAMAMTNSTTAAEEMSAELSLIYSKMRQEQITTEIIEISTGATQTLKANAKKD